MELQFDKEIDAILRKARKGVADGAASSGHVDADAIAAFAENAVPEKARVLYMNHFADCGPCRRLLAEAVPWPPAQKKAASSAAPIVSSLPWYSRLFRMPSLAVAMGAMILVFGGLLAFLVVNRNGQRAGDTVSQMMNTETRSEAPYQNQAAAANNANSNAAAANLAANVESAPDAAKPGSTSVANTGRGPANEPSASGSGSGFATDGVAADQPAAEPEPKAVGSSPPPPVAAEKPGDDERSRKDEDKAETERDMKLSKADEDRMNREAAPAPSKKAPAGPNRAYGPRQNTQQNATTDSTNVGQGMIGGAVATAVKTAGGKKFEKRDGVWYDTSYHGQWTRNYTRGSDAYQGLDEGLRSIASKIGGVVVVVWKGNAYRIQ